jgi:ATP-dependent RNA helicase DeaD
MPQEPQSNEKNKSNQRFSGRRRSFADTFRWGFVPEEDSANEKRDEPKPRASAPTEGPDADSSAKSKRNRQHKKVAKMAVTKPKEAPKVKAVTPAPKPSDSKEPTPKKRPSKGKGRAKAVVPAYIANSSYDEDDEDLKLPSYGRTPIPTDDELPTPQKNARKPLQPPKKAAPRVSAELPVSQPVSDVTSVGFRPRREQMVWDPDKSEYVPLVVVKEPEPAAPKRSSKRTEPPKLDKRREQTEKPTPKPKAEQLPETLTEKTVDGRRQTAAKGKQPPIKKDHREVIGAQAGDVANNSPTVVVSRPRSAVQPKERLPRHGDSRRSSIPKFIDSSHPDPADIEAEVSGFAELGVSDVMLEALKMVRYLSPTPIQAGVFQKVSEGVDLMGQAQTGTGKTAAFSMPIIEGVETCPPGNNPVALILVPTRELAVQVRDEAARLSYGRDIRVTACYGGKPLGKQIERLKSGIDIVVGTPGRVLDLMNRRALFLDSLRWVVLDEADRMLDIGFRPDIEKILKRTPQERQTLLFSATLPPPVVRLAERYMKSPEVLDFSNKSVAVDTIDQFYVTVDPERKFDALVYLLEEQQPKQAIIFTRTKRGADRLARLLMKKFDKLAAIHGDLQQSERDRVMAQVRSGTLRYLVATDVVGRGIDVSGISHIINYDIPKFCDDYVHRVGRTGRMGREGVAFTFVTVQEGSELTRIEMRIDKLLKRGELKGFESFTKPHDPNATLDEEPEPPKPVFGKPMRKVRRAL